MVALAGMIGRSIRHSAPGTLAALIRSLGLLASQGQILQHNTDQMTALLLYCLIKVVAGGRRKASV